MIRLALATILAATMFSTALGAPVVGPGNVDACRSIYHTLDDEGLMDVGSTADLVLLGSVKEQYQGPGADYGALVRVEAVLKGKAPGAEIEIWGLGTDCPGGAKLNEGERVLVALFRYARSHTADDAEMTWSLFPVFGKTLIEADDARIVSPTLGQHTLGTPAEAVRLWGIATGASEGQTAAALAAVGERPETHAFRTLYVVMIGGIAALLLIRSLAVRARGA